MQSNHSRRMHAVLLIVSFFFSFYLPILVVARQSRGDQNAVLCVKIVAEKRRINPGESVALSVEIWNISTKPVFIHREFNGPSNALTTLTFSLTHGTQVYASAGALVVDSFERSRSHPPLANELAKFWIALPPGHFYGGRIIVDSDSFRQLDAPGEYQLHGKYASRGFLADDMNNPLLDYAGELKELPYECWTGEVETNSVNIEVVAKPRQERKK
jgi:hypothetical protein